MSLHRDATNWQQTYQKESTRRRRRNLAPFFGQKRNSLTTLSARNCFSYNETIEKASLFCLVDVHSRSGDRNEQSFAAKTQKLQSFNTRDVEKIQKRAFTYLFEKKKATSKCSSIVNCNTQVLNKRERIEEKLDACGKQKDSWALNLTEQGSIQCSKLARNKLRVDHRTKHGKNNYEIWFRITNTRGKFEIECRINTRKPIILRHKRWFTISTIGYRRCYCYCFYSYCWRWSKRVPWSTNWTLHRLAISSNRRRRGSCLSSFACHRRRSVRARCPSSERSPNRFICRWTSD